MGNNITTEMLLKIIENKGWVVGDMSTVHRIDVESYNLELQRKIKVLEKSLELACNKIGDMFGSNYQEAWFFADVGNSIITREYFEEYFKTKAIEKEFIELQKKSPVNDDKKGKWFPLKAVEILKKYIDLIEDVYYYTSKYLNDTEDILIDKDFDILLDKLDDLLERKEKEAKDE